MKIADAVAAVGTANPNVEKINGVERTACDGQRRFIYLVPSVMAPEVAVAIDSSRHASQSARTEALGLRPRCPAREWFARRMCAHTGNSCQVGGGECAVVIAARVYRTMYSEGAQELRDVSEDGAETYEAGIPVNIRPVNLVLMYTAPSTLLALRSSLCHLDVPVMRQASFF